MLIAKLSFHFQLKLTTKLLYFSKTKSLSWTILWVFSIYDKQFRNTLQHYLEISYKVYDNIYQYLNINNLKLTFSKLYYQTESFHKKKLLRWAHLRSVFVNKRSQYHLQKLYHHKEFKLYFIYNKLFLNYLKKKWKLFFEIISLNNFVFKITKN